VIENMVEFPEFVMNPDIVRDEIKHRMVNNFKREDGYGSSYPLFLFPFKLVSLSEVKDGAFGAKTRTRINSSDMFRSLTESEKKSGWPTVTVKVPNLELRENIEKVYALMGWELTDQLCKKFFGAIKKDTKIPDELKEIASKFIKWHTMDGFRKKEFKGIEPNPMKNLKSLCEFAEKIEGRKLTAVFVNDANFYEFWDFVEAKDVDADLGHRVRSTCEDATYLKDLELWLIGVSSECLSEGSVVGVYSKYNLPLVEILGGYDSKFGKWENCDAEDYETMIRSNIPLNVNIYQGGSKDEEEEDEAVKDRVTIETWIDFKVQVKNENSGFYLEDGI